jgi:DNA-binding transcriptional MerR regulator
LPARETFAKAAQKAAFGFLSGPKKAVMPAKADISLGQELGGKRNGIFVSENSGSAVIRGHPLSKRIQLFILLVSLSACTSSEVISDYATAYRLLDIHASVLNSRSGSEIAALRVYEKTNALLPVRISSVRKVTAKDDVEISVVVGLQAQGLGFPDVKVIVDDRNSSEVLASKLFEKVRIERADERKTLLIKVPHAACKALRITVLSSSSELAMNGLHKGVFMHSLCREW